MKQAANHDTSLTKQPNNQELANQATTDTPLLHPELNARKDENVQSSLQLVSQATEKEILYYSGSALFQLQKEHKRKSVQTAENILITTAKTSKNKNKQKGERGRGGVGGGGWGWGQNKTNQRENRGIYCTLTKNSNKMQNKQRKPGAVNLHMYW